MPQPGSPADGPEPKLGRHLLHGRADAETTSVTEVAMTCGLRHLGRFAAEYHDRYGETPSQTLHRREVPMRP